MTVLKVSKPFQALYDNNKHNVIMNNPRISGKSFELGQIEAVYFKLYPDYDEILCRANANSLEESMLNEFLEKLDMIGLVEDVDYRVQKNPLKVYHLKGHKGVVYFKGVSGSDTSRVRSIKPKNKVSLVSFDECQQINNELSLKHALASFRRHIAVNLPYKIIQSGNPVEVKAHWWNKYCERYKYAKDYVFIDSNYKEIINLLPKEVIEDIELERQLNPAMYKIMYLGDISELSGGAYGQFRKEKHYITEQKAGEIFAGERIEYVIFGTDGAITHDATCICPIAILSSGRALVLERFYYDPLMTGQVLAPVQLVDLIKLYLSALEKKYRFKDQYCEKIFAIDCASADLIAQLRYDLDDSFLVTSFTDKNIIRNNSVVNNAFAKNVLYIKDFGGQYMWYNHSTYPADPLIDQLESVVWKNNKFDPEIPNDCTDALTYGVNYYFLNPDNLAFPERQKAYE